MWKNLVALHVIVLNPPAFRFFCSSGWCAALLYAFYFYFFSIILLLGGALAGLIDSFFADSSRRCLQFAGPITVAHRQQRSTLADFQTASVCHRTTYASLDILGVQVVIILIYSRMSAE